MKLIVILGISPLPLLDLAKANGSDVWELPIPGSYVIAQDGTIALSFVDPDYTHRLEPAAILNALRKL